MNRAGTLVCFAVFAMMTACSGDKGPVPTSNQPAPTAQQPPTAEAAPPKVEPGDLQVGQASGSYTAKGATVELKYAYAGRAQRFGNEATVIILTEKPIPAEAVAAEIQSQKMLLDEKIRGLEYAIDKDGYWVRYHPGQYQESKNGQLKEFSIEGNIVRGRDEDNGDFTTGKYSRSVKFVAAIVK